jgi:rare lipoprotein A
VISKMTNEHKKTPGHLLVAGLSLLLVTACTTTPPAQEYEYEYGSPADRLRPDYAPDGSVGPLSDGPITEPTPKVEPKSGLGNPPYYEVDGVVYHVKDSGDGYKDVGVASWYGQKFHGRRTSSGEVYDMYQFTAAHKTLPLPSYAKVTNLDNGQSVIVKINDRGPFKKNRLIDLSYAASKKLGYQAQGTARVEVEVLASPRNTGAVSSAQIAKAGELELPPMDEQKDNAQLFVQVGAFADPLRADTLAARLRDHFGQPIAISDVDVNGQKLQRVRIGPLRDARTAENILRQLNEYNFGTPKVVTE